MRPEKVSYAVGIYRRIILSAKSPIYSNNTVKLSTAVVPSLWDITGRESRCLPVFLLQSETTNMNQQLNEKLLESTEGFHEDQRQLQEDLKATLDEKDK